MIKLPVPPFDVQGVPNLVYAEREVCREENGHEYFVETGVCEFPSGWQTYLFSDRGNEILPYAEERGRVVPQDKVYSFSGGMPLTVMVFSRAVVLNVGLGARYSHVTTYPSIVVGWSDRKNLFYENGLNAELLPPRLPNVDSEGYLCSGASYHGEFVPFNSSLASAVDRWKVAPGNQDILRLEGLYEDSMGDTFYRWEEKSCEGMEQGAAYLYEFAANHSHERKTNLTLSKAIHFVKVRSYLNAADVSGNGR